MSETDDDERNADVKNASDAEASDRDAKVRALLVQSGDDGRTPRLTRFYFKGGDMEKLRTAATGEGYQAQNTPQEDGIILETTVAVDEESFAPHSQRMEQWADEFGAEYLGWETELLTQ
jgi:hypothetical protein